MRGGFLPRRLRGSCLHPEYRQSGTGGVAVTATCAHDATVLKLRRTWQISYETCEEVGKDVLDVDLEVDDQCDIDGHGEPAEKADDAAEVKVEEEMNLGLKELAVGEVVPRCGWDNSAQCGNERYGEGRLRGSQR